MAVTSKAFITIGSNNLILGIFILVIIQFILGKKGAFPVGIILGLNLISISLIVILCDLILMIFADRIIKTSARSFRQFDILGKRLNRLNTWLTESKTGKRLQKSGVLGVFAITAIPFTGGVWSGVALSNILSLTRNTMYRLVVSGSVIGCAIFYLAALGVIQII